MGHKIKFKPNDINYIFEITNAKSVYLGLVLL